MQSYTAPSLTFEDDGRGLLTRVHVACHRQLQLERKAPDI